MGSVIVILSFFMASSVWADTPDQVPQLQPKAEACDKRLSGLEPAELIKHLTEATSDGKSGVEIVSTDKQSDLDHVALGPEGQEIYDRLDMLVVGHEDVKMALARAVQRAATGTKNSKKPVGTFLLLGITGTGKTLIAEALSEALGIDPESLPTIDCGEIQRDHEVSKLTSSPPGYVGHDDTPPMISQDILDAATSSKYKVNVVLVDEVEKAAPALQKLLLGVTGKGKMSSGKNKKIDFRNTIVIMTSNLGQEEMQAVLNEGQTGVGFVQVQSNVSREKRLKKAALRATKNFFSPEFRNRIDQTFVFTEHTEEEAQRVLSMNLADAQRRSFFSNEKTRIVFNVSPEARRHLLTVGYEPEFGGRSMRRNIEHSISEPLSNLLGSGKIRAGDLINVGVSEKTGELTFRKVATGLDMSHQKIMYDAMYGTAVPGLDSSPAKPKDKRVAELAQKIKDKALVAELTTIYEFVKDTADFDDTAFLGAMKLMPKLMGWGQEKGTETTVAMKEAGFQQWQNLPFDPIFLRVGWVGMRRLESLDVKNRSAMDEFFTDYMDRIAAWLEAQNLKDDFRKELKTFLKNLHAKVMKLPASPK